MEFSWSKEEQAYRKELRDLVKDNLPPDWWEGYAYDGPANPKLMKFARGFDAKLAAKGHVVSHWPKAYGGRESPPWEHIILSEEMWSEGEPRSSLYLGSNWAGPVIIMFGTEEQKRIHLNNIAQGKVLWCQGFSEPEAGSDLASLRTRAERLPEGGYVINGRKIWTSYAHSADWIFMLARLEAEGRGGVTCFMLPTNTPGLTFKTIPGLYSAHDFHESTFDNVRVPESARLGEEGRGWELVTAALHHERVGQAHYENSQRGLLHAVELLKSSGRFDDPVVQAQAASCMAQLEAARLLVYRVIDQRARNQPPTALTSVARLAMIRSNHAVANFITSFLPEAMTEGESMDGRLQWVFKFALVSGIASGAAEVQQNLISGRYLGLPKGT
jgi:alkylation response protein AidB-like acyl-CoA dehydrogenase